MSSVSSKELLSAAASDQQDLRGTADDAPHRNEPQDYSTPPNGREKYREMMSMNCESFELSDENLGLCLSNRSREDPSAIISADSQFEADAITPNSSQEDDNESDLSEFDETAIMRNFNIRKSTGVTRVSMNPKQSVRRHTDGGLAKANKSLNASIRFSNEKQRIMSNSKGRSSDADLLEESSVKGPTCRQRFLSRIYEMMSCTSMFSPIRRYKRKKSGIQVMKNQCFVPPPSDGVTFIGSLMNTMRGFGVDFVIWVNQSSFFTALILFLSSYYALVCLFAGILVHMEKKTDGKCLDLDDVWITKDQYELAFELSWTTFTTVGYGQISPSGYEYGCYPTRVLCASFAFMGLLFNSLSAAVFFSKLESFLTRSCVTFSSSICIQQGRRPNSRRSSHIGQLLRRDSLTALTNFSQMSSNQSTGLDNAQYDDEMKNVGRKKSSLRGHTVSSNNEIDVGAPNNANVDLVLHAAEMSRAIPYPFLEFRIVNEHANYKKREIRNAHVAAMVQLTPADAEGMMDRNASVTQLLREYVTPAPSRLSSPSSEHSYANKSMKNVLDTKERRAKYTRYISSDMESIRVIREDSGTGENIGPEGRVYIPLTLEPSSHPYFKRVYYVQHVLDSKSPLLKPSVRRKIKNGWDPSMSTHQDIRESLVDFRRIRVMFKGNSAVNNSMVFAEKVYTLDNLFVGWQFGNIFYKREKWTWWKWGEKKDGSQQNDYHNDDSDLLLDKRLIHDIFPQENAEPIRNGEDDSDTSSPRLMQTKKFQN